MRVLLLGYYTYDNSNKLLTMSLNGAEYYYIINAKGMLLDYLIVQAKM